MPARDVYHDIVKAALIKDGWTKEGRKIAVEVKSFVSDSEVTELERALGQYELYRFLLARREPERKLYLAIPRDVHTGFMNEPDSRDLIAAASIKLLVFDPEQEVVIQWTE